MAGDAGEQDEREVTGGEGIRRKEKERKKKRKKMVKKGYYGYFIFSIYFK